MWRCCCGHSGPSSCVSCAQPLTRELWRDGRAANYCGKRRSGAVPSAILQNDNDLSIRRWCSGVVARLQAHGRWCVSASLSARNVETFYVYSSGARRSTVGGAAAAVCLAELRKYAENTKRIAAGHNGYLWCVSYSSKRKEQNYETQKHMLSCVNTFHFVIFHYFAAKLYKERHLR